MVKRYIGPSLGLGEGEFGDWVKWSDYSTELLEAAARIALQHLSD